MDAYSTDACLPHVSHTCRSIYYIMACSSGMESWQGQTHSCTRNPIIIVCSSFAVRIAGWCSTQVVLPMQVGVQGLAALSAASVLRKLCLFNCKLGQEAADAIVDQLNHRGFLSLRELDLTGNVIEAPQMQTLLTALQQHDVAPALQVLLPDLAGSCAKSAWCRCHVETSKLACAMSSNCVVHMHV